MCNKTTNSSSAEVIDIPLLQKQITARCRSKLLSIGVTEEQAKVIIQNDINSNRSP
jgi:hypothetical protein